MDGEEWGCVTESEHLRPLAHIDWLRFGDFAKPIKEQSDCHVNIWLQLFQLVHAVYVTNKPAMLSVDFLIPASKQIELPMALPHGVPIAFPELGAGAVNDFD